MDEQIAVLAVADKGSLEAAGKYLGVGRSAVRKRIQGVENELGTSLFYSSRSRGMVPTEAGNLYLLQARESVRHAWLGIDRVRAGDSDLGQVVVLSGAGDADTREAERRLRIDVTDATRIAKANLVEQMGGNGVVVGE